MFNDRFSSSLSFDCRSLFQTISKQHRIETLSSRKRHEKITVERARPRTRFTVACAINQVNKVEAPYFVDGTDGPYPVSVEASDERSGPLPTKKSI